MLTYVILRGARRGYPDAIKCLVCERVSYHPNDIAQRYCPFCHRFHEDQDLEE